MMTASPLWWLLALAGLLPWVGPWRGTNVVQNVLRSLCFVSLSLALSRPFLVRDDAPAQRVLIWDRSDSVDADPLDESIAFGSQGDRRDSHVIVLGGCDPESCVELDRAFSSVTVMAAEGPEGSSPLDAAFSRAASLIPRGGTGSVTIATDGLSTRQDDSRAIASLRLRGIPIDVVPLPVRDIPATPTALSWGDELRVGTTAVVSAVIVAHGESIPGTVSLRLGDRVVATSRYEGGKREEVLLEFEPESAGFIPAEVVLASDEPTRQPTSFSVVLPVQDPHRVVYLRGLQREGAARLSDAVGRGFDVQEVDPADQATLASALAACDLVVLDDCQADSFPLPAERSLVDAVKGEGLGMLMSGGRSSFGSGGWHDRPLEEILPIELVQKEEKRDPSTTLVVVIDTSGSMTGVRVQLAKEVARLAMRRLLPHDKVGIVEFYGAKRWAAPIQPASNAIELQRALNRMDAGGGTVILPALEEAFYGLQNVDTRYKHVLVLTDGGVESGDFESLMRRMAGEGINVSTVLAGGGYHSEFLVNIANWGKGRFYNVPNRFNLPEILLKQPSTAKLPPYRPGIHPVRARGGSGWWGEVDTQQIPELAGYVEAKSRPDSEVLLETVDSGHPVLTTWRYGLGRVTTMGTEPVGNGTRPWQQWDGYGRALARILERTSADSRDPFRYRWEHDGGQMIVRATRQRPRSSAAEDPIPVGRVIGNEGVDGEFQKLEFVARGPDHFVATLQAAPRESEQKLECSADTTPDRTYRMVAPTPVSDELGVDPRRGIDLASLAAVAGGETIALGGDWASQRVLATGGDYLVPLSPWLFAIALVLFLVEIVWRRRSQTAT